MNKSRRYLIIAGLLFFAGLVLFSCGGNGDPGTPQAVTPPAGQAPSIPGGHQENWIQPGIHGPGAKAAPGASTGYASCQTCHGNDFRGGVSQMSCLSNTACHQVSAPHPRRPWSGGSVTHTNTDQGNVQVCAICHADGSNSTVKPLVPPPGGPSPGCYNNTLCHGLQQGQHPQGWSAPDRHGAEAKKVMSAAAGFSSCQPCHGDNFSGGSVQVTCLSAGTCHRAAAPHPPKTWTEAGRSHTTADQSNVPVCAQCHTNGANSSLAPLQPAPPGTQPGCFNATLCHTQAGHPDGWTVGHSLQARSSVTSCGTAACHGTDFRGGGTGISCFRCHLGGPNPGANIQHPNRWTNPRGSHDGYLESQGKNASSCSPTSPRGAGVAQYCHGSGLSSSSVRIAPPNGSWTSGPSCYKCHGKEWSEP